MVQYSKLLIKEIGNVLLQAAVVFVGGDVDPLLIDEGFGVIKDCLLGIFGNGDIGFG